MTQFASTLYPQTNPTNPVLLKFREIPQGVDAERKKYLLRMSEEGLTP